MRAVLIDVTTNEVVNTIELERDAIWECPAGFRVVFSETARQGQLHIERTFVDP